MQARGGAPWESLLEQEAAGWGSQGAASSESAAGSGRFRGTGAAGLRPAVESGVGSRIEGSTVRSGRRAVVRCGCVGAGCDGCEVLLYMYDPCVPACPCVSRLYVCVQCSNLPRCLSRILQLIDMVVGLAHFAPIAAAPPPLLWRRCAVTSCARQVYDDGPFAVAPMMCAQLLERLAPVITVLTIGLDTFPFFSVSGTTRIVSFGTCCACSADGPRCTRRW